MAVCEICGTSFTAKRRDARYCGPTCRKAASRKVAKARKQAEALTMTLEGQAMLQKLRKVLPRTAASVEAFILANGAGCAESAVKLVLTAYAEAQKVA